jgi:hypothetical protein
MRTVREACDMRCSRADARGRDHDPELLMGGRQRYIGHAMARCPDISDGIPQAHSQDVRRFEGVVLHDIQYLHKPRLDAWLRVSGISGGDANGLKCERYILNYLKHMRPDDASWEVHRPFVHIVRVSWCISRPPPKMSVL